MILKKTPTKGWTFVASTPLFLLLFSMSRECLLLFVGIAWTINPLVLKSLPVFVVLSALQIIFVY